MLCCMKDLVKDLSFSLLREIADFVGIKFENEHLRELLPAIQLNFKTIALMNQRDLDKSIEPASFLSLILGSDHESR